MAAADELQRIEPDSRAAWRDWLAANHGQAASVWLIYARKGACRPTLSLEDGIEEALCFGWIDSLPRKLDEQRSMILISPRKPRSNWSAVNKRRVERLQAAGLIAPSGAAVIAAAREDGSWHALDAVERLEVPGDLAAALSDLPPARANWDSFPASARRGILEWIGNARRAETRAARVQETAQKARIGERANQWRGRS